MAAMGESSVVRLMYVADIPKPSNDEVRDLSWIHDDPHLIVYDDGTFVLDNDWWLNEEAGTTFPLEVVDHLRRNPRRPVTMAAMQAPRSAAWRTVPTTVLLGRTDQLVTDEEPLGDGPPGRRPILRNRPLRRVSSTRIDQRRRHRSTQPEPGSPIEKLTSRRRDPHPGRTLDARHQCRNKPEHRAGMPVTDSAKSSGAASPPPVAKRTRTSSSEIAATKRTTLSGNGVFTIEPR